MKRKDVAAPEQQCPQHTKIEKQKKMKKRCCSSRAAMSTTYKNRETKKKWHRCQQSVDCFWCQQANAGWDFCKLFSVTVCYLEDFLSPKREETQRINMVEIGSSKRPQNQKSWLKTCGVHAWWSQLHQQTGYYMYHPGLQDTQWNSTSLQDLPADQDPFGFLTLTRQLDEFPLEHEMSSTRGAHTFFFVAWNGKYRYKREIENRYTPIWFLCVFSCILVVFEETIKICFDMRFLCCNRFFSNAFILQKTQKLSYGKHKNLFKTQDVPLAILPLWKQLIHLHQRTCFGPLWENERTQKGWTHLYIFLQFHLAVHRCLFRACVFSFLLCKELINSFH